jgi:hypothetical protein
MEKRNKRMEKGNKRLSKKAGGRKAREAQKQGKKAGSE